MPEQLAGLPYWQFEFGENGERLSVPAAAALAAELTAADVTDLFVFSHGWNNSPQAARDLYTRFYSEMARFATSPSNQPRLQPNVVIGISGVIWPSMRWVDEGAPAASPASPAAAIGGSSSIGGQPVPDDATTVGALAPMFPDPRQQKTLRELGQLLQDRPNDEAALARFQALMGSLIPAPTSGTPAPEEQGERALVEKNYQDVFGRMALAAQAVGAIPGAEGGGAAAAGGPLAGLWDGAKQALRELTYWQMKERAGVVGEQGLGPFLVELHTALPALRLHLIGHSFGSRLVSFTLKGIAQPGAGETSPVKSVNLLQGAFSHFSFASTLPQDRSRAGALNGVQSRVDGPIAVSFSQFDTAVGTLYPWASMVAGQDASDQNDPMYPWGAMGHDGAQAVSATSYPYGPPGTVYQFAPGGFFNMDGNAVIVAGGPPAGAHGDICHPEIAWATLAAAGIAAV